jgi:hypothetical protein
MKLILITSLPLLLALGKIPLLAFAQDSGLKVIVDLEVPSSWCGKVFSITLRAESAVFSDWIIACEGEIYLNQHLYV